jgi:glycosyltransferase involved in cell wall biosynthesis/putative flippase GtrA
MSQDSPPRYAPRHKRGDGSYVIQLQTDWLGPFRSGSGRGPGEALNLIAPREDAVPGMPAAHQWRQGPRRFSPSGPNNLIARHRTRFVTFSVIGALIFVLGLALQALLVQLWHANSVTSYAAVGVGSIQASFVLNRWLTWKDRQVSFWLACYRFNVQKVVTAVLNFLLYAELVRLGVNYLVANVLMTGVFTIVNYVAGDSWAFAARTPTETAPAVPAPIHGPTAVAPDTLLPSVSVIVPCKSNERTIRATVESLLGQDYPALAEVILVGSMGDTTWRALRDVMDPRLIILEHDPNRWGLEPNVKRDEGIRHATADVVALADSDIVMDSDWLSKAVPMLLAQEGGLVAGGMRSIHDSFWGRFVDRNVVAAKTPRLDHPYYVTAANFGRRGSKPPITANAVFAREVYEACPLDVAWGYGYEDYEWFWRLAQGGHKILFSGDLTAAHHHRRSFRRLAREYRQSAEGCAYFIRRHPDCPLARKRLWQALTLPLAGLAALTLAGLSITAGNSVVLGGVVLASIFALAGREAVRSHSMEALTYPAVGLTLAVLFTIRLAASLGRLATTKKGLMPDTQVIVSQEERAQPATQAGVSSA